MTWQERMSLWIGLETPHSLNTTKYQYSEFWVVKDQLIDVLNEYGQKGWRAIHIVEIDYTLGKFLILMEKKAEKVDDTCCIILHEEHV